ncbi:hypothetical protein PybrP1_010739 [[Pythium] brassicae (nom. inval.)]|nr:hypothetical protein PybrP1_010739 [[Pythium] brassicae (nom. inval.)]
MGHAGSSLVDCACDGDIQRLKAALQERRQQLERATSSSDSNNNNSAERHTQWLAEVEAAAHAVVSTEVLSAQQFQQLQIALELLLQANPDAWGSSVGNAVGWTGAHRACVTGNLSFLAFVFQRYDAHDVQERDAFGLFPLDLVPPELLRSPADMARDAALEPRVGGGAEPIFPATARARRNLALQILRQKKREAQARCVDQFVFHEHASQAPGRDNPSATSASAAVGKHDMSGHQVVIAAPSDDNNNEDRVDDNQRAEHDTHTVADGAAAELAVTGAYFVAFEPCRDRIAADAATGSVGEVHDRSTPLRLRYRFPRLDEFVHGYFQLIWRESEPRSEKPHYGAHVLMRDEVFLDPPAGATSAARRLADANPVLQGCFPFDVSQLPHDAVCNVLFVASDRHLMKRTVVLSTEAIALRDANDGDDFLDPRNNNGAVRNGDGDGDSDEGSADSDEQSHPFVFHVASEAFSHPNPAFADRDFDGLEDFEQFVKVLRAASTSSRAEGTRGRRATGATVADGESQCGRETTVKESPLERGADGPRPTDEQQWGPEAADSRRSNQREHKAEDKEEEDNNERRKQPEQAAVDKKEKA